MGRVTFIDCHVTSDPILLRVNKFILAKDLTICNYDGMEFTPGRSHNGDFGILLNDPEAKPQICWFGLVKKRPLRNFVGFFPYATSNEENVIFKLYGRENVEWAKNLANELASALDIGIVIQLMSEKPKKETLDTAYHGPY